MLEFRLAAVLKLKKMSKRQFAKVMGLKYGNIFRLFRKDYDPKLSMIELICARLELRLRDLVRLKK